MLLEGGENEENTKVFCSLARPDVSNAIAGKSVVRFFEMNHYDATVSQNAGEQLPQKMHLPNLDKRTTDSSKKFILI